VVAMDKSGVWGVAIDLSGVFVGKVTQLLAVFQLYHGGKFCCCRKP
jgi:hypothetical protein